MILGRLSHVECHCVFKEFHFIDCIDPLARTPPVFNVADPHSKMLRFILIQMKQNAFTLLIALLAPCVITALMCYLITTQMTEKQYSAFSLHSLPELPAELA